MPTVGDALHLATDCLLILDPLRQGHHGAQSGLPPPSVTAPTVGAHFAKLRAPYNAHSAEVAQRPMEPHSRSRCAATRTCEGAC